MSESKYVWYLYGKPFFLTVVKGYGNSWDLQQQRQVSSDKRLYFHSLVFLLIVSVSTRVHGFKHDYILIIGRLQTFLDCNTINGLRSSFSGSFTSERNLEQF